MAFKNVFAKMKAAPSAALSSCEELSLAESTKSLSSSMKNGPSREDARRAMLLENVLVNLGVCHEISYRLNAEKLGIPLKEVFVQFPEERAMNTLLDLRHGEGRSNQPIQIVVVLESSASDSDLASLKEAVDCHCPGLNVLRNLAPIQSSIRSSSSWSVAAE